LLFGRFFVLSGSNNITIKKKYMSRVIHFDIYADDPERASAFYEKAFGWKFKKWEGDVGMDYWLIMTGDEKSPGIDGGMSKREKEWSKAVSDGAITIGVENIDAAIGKVEENGGEIVMKKMGLSTVGWFASFRDTEGNRLSLMQSDPSVK
jgi:hypothetical protein